MKHKSKHSETWKATEFLTKRELSNCGANLHRNKGGQMNEIFEQINERGEIIKKAMHVVEQTTSSSQDWRPVSFSILLFSSTSATDQT